MDWGDDEEDWADFAAAPTDQNNTNEFSSSVAEHATDHQEITSGGTIYHDSSDALTVEPLSNETAELIVDEPAKDQPVEENNKNELKLDTVKDTEASTTLGTIGPIVDQVEEVVPKEGVENHFVPQADHTDDHLESDEVEPVKDKELVEVDYPLSDPVVIESHIPEELHAEPVSDHFAEQQLPTEDVQAQPEPPVVEAIENENRAEADDPVDNPFAELKTEELIKDHADSAEAPGLHVRDDSAVAREHAAAADAPEAVQDHFAGLDTSGPADIHIVAGPRVAVLESPGEEVPEVHHKPAEQEADPFAGLEAHPPVAAEPLAPAQEALKAEGPASDPFAPAAAIGSQDEIAEAVAPEPVLEANQPDQPLPQAATDTEPVEAHVAAPADDRHSDRSDHHDNNNDHAGDDEDDEWNDFAESVPVQQLPEVREEVAVSAVAALPSAEAPTTAEMDEEEDAWDDFESAAPVVVPVPASSSPIGEPMHREEFAPQFDDEFQSAAVPSFQDEDEDEWNAFEGTTTTEPQAEAQPHRSDEGAAFDFEADFGDFAAADSFGEPLPASDHLPNKDEKLGGSAADGLAGIDGLEALARLLPDGWRRDFALPLAALKELGGRLFSEEKLRPSDVLEALPAASSSTAFWTAAGVQLLAPPITPFPSPADATVAQLRLILRTSVPTDALSVEEVKTSFIRRDFSVTQEDREAKPEKAIALVSVPSMDRPPAESPRARLSGSKAVVASSLSPAVAAPAAVESTRAKEPATAPSSRDPPPDDLSAEELSHAAVVFLRSLPDFSFLLEQS